MNEEVGHLTIQATPDSYFIGVRWCMYTIPHVSEFSLAQRYAQNRKKFSGELQSLLLIPHRSHLVTAISIEEKCHPAEVLAVPVFIEVRSD